MTAVAVRWPARLESAALARLARDAKVRDAITRAYSLTGLRRDRIRRSEVVKVCASALGVPPWNITNAFYEQMTDLLRASLGITMVRVGGIRWFVGVAHREVSRVSRVSPKPGTPSFEKLRREWYDRADPYGDDLEDSRDPDAPLSNRGTLTVKTEGRAKVRTLGQVEAQAAFRAAAERFLHEYRFGTEVDRRIWHLVVLGEPASDIARQLRMRKQTVLAVIRRLKEAMARRQEDEG